MPREVVDAAHYGQLSEHGGSHGIRDENVLESALARPRNRFLYDPEADLAQLAAAYAYAIATSHPFTDGNKRTAFMVAAIFLGYNGMRPGRTNDEVVEAFLKLAGGELAEDELAEWFRGGMRKM